MLGIEITIGARFDSNPRPKYQEAGITTTRIEVKLNLSTNIDAHLRRNRLSVYFVLVFDVLWRLDKLVVISYRTRAEKTPIGNVTCATAFNSRWPCVLSDFKLCV